MKKKGVLLRVEGIDIVGELYIPEQGDRKTFSALCLCHGIPSGKPPEPGDKGYPHLAKKFCAAGFATLIFNFRGTGLSGGNFDLLGWTRDLEAIIDYLYSYPEVNSNNISLMGFSGGAAVSAYVAAHNPKVTSVILCSCPSQFGFMRELDQSLAEHFRSIGVIRDKDFPRSVDEWLEGFKHIAPTLWVDKISPRPLLILHGEEDDLVSKDNAWAIYHEAKEPKEIAIIGGAGHKLRLSEKAMDIALEWLKRSH